MMEVVCACVCLYASAYETCHVCHTIGRSSLGGEVGRLAELINKLENKVCTAYYGRQLESSTQQLCGVICA